MTTQKTIKLEQQIIEEFEKKFTTLNKKMPANETMIFEPTTTKIKTFFLNWVRKIYEHGHSDGALDYAKYSWKCENDRLKKEKI